MYIPLKILGTGPQNIFRLTGTSKISLRRARNIMTTVIMGIFPRMHISRAANPADGISSNKEFILF